MTFIAMTWNVENFSNASPPEKLDLLVDTINLVRPDVVALQEVLTDASPGTALGMLATRLGYTPLAGTADSRGNRVAFLFRAGGPVASQVITAWRLPAGVLVQDHGAGGAVATVAALPRPALMATINHGGRQIDIINVHLKSKLLTFPGGAFSTTNETLRAETAYFALQRRAAEAKTIREHVTDQLAAQHDVLVLGDFNDGPLAATTEILYGPSGSQPRGPEDATSPRAFQRADAGDPRRLFNVTMLVPPDERWSRRHEGQPELLDQILASEGLMPRSGTLRETPQMDILNDDLPNLGGQPRTTAAIPDHAPVIATFAA